MSVHDSATPAELAARWAFRVRNECSVAMHAMDVGNFAAARVALESAQQFVGMLEQQEQRERMAAMQPPPAQITGGQA